VHFLFAYGLSLPFGVVVFVGLLVLNFSNLEKSIEPEGVGLVLMRYEDDVLELKVFGVHPGIGVVQFELVDASFGGDEGRLGVVCEFLFREQQFLYFHFAFEIPHVVQPHGDVATLDAQPEVEEGVLVVDLDGAALDLA
jgi:hypothetical protein